MMSLPKCIRSRSTLFGFAVVILLSASIVVALLVQVDNWSRSSFDLVKNNTQQLQLVMNMRDAVQKRELIIQRMLNKNEMFARDEESIAFHQQAGVYASARGKLIATQLNEALVNNLRELDAAVSYVQPYHDNLVEALIFEDMKNVEVEAIIKEGRKGTLRVLYLLDKIVERQSSGHEAVISRYEQSRQLTLLLIAVVFTLIAIVVVYALRTSSKQFKHISRLSIIDEVSGTYNRRYFDMVLEEEWKRSMREYTPLSLLMLDIDYFKAYNDSFGHQLGDVCLYTIGKILAGELKRTTDFISRYGGEEFAIVLSNTTAEHARLLAERLRRSVEEARIEAGNDEVSPWVTVSIGVATTTAEYGQVSSDLVKTADSCLYKSKQNGRNQVSNVMLDDVG